jgi:hypothetical protein
LEKGLKYKLITFNGTIDSEEILDSNENYWKLIGQEGTLINFLDDLNFGNDERVLIKFDEDLVAQGLECHNSVPSSLWILRTDLALLNLQS